MIPATAIPLFKNIALDDYNGTYYDLHNDYNCNYMALESKSFTLTFNKVVDKSRVVLNFNNAAITKLAIKVLQEPDAVTVDNIYRGRFQEGETLVETDKYGRCYFYIDFCDETSFELWADSISLTDNDKM